MSRQLSDAPQNLAQFERWRGQKQSFTEIADRIRDQFGLGTGEREERVDVGQDNT